MDGQHVSLSEGPILVALDQARHARSALRVVKALCARLDRSVVVTHVGEPALSSEEVLERLGLSPEDVAGVVVEPLGGRPEAVLPEAARVRRCSLLVLGLSPQEGEPGVLLAHLLKHAPCPVLLVPPDLVDRWGEAGLVLLPLDGTPSTASVAPLAIDVAVRCGASLEILYVGGAKLPGEPGSMGLPSFLDQPQHEWAMWKREFLYRFCECHWGGKLPVDVTLTLATGDPGDAILELAGRHEPDMIVIGWHGELEHAHAQTLRKLLSHSRWPVMTARV